MHNTFFFNVDKLAMFNHKYTKLHVSYYKVYVFISTSRVTQRCLKKKAVTRAKTFEKPVTLLQCVPEIDRTRTRKTQQNVNVWFTDLLQGCSIDIKTPIILKVCSIFHTSSDIVSCSYPTARMNIEKCYVCEPFSQDNMQNYSPKYSKLAEGERTN